MFEAGEHELEVSPPNVAPFYAFDAIRRSNDRFPFADRSYVGEWKPDAPTLLIGIDQLHNFKLMTDVKPESPSFRTSEYSRVSSVE